MKKLTAILLFSVLLAVSWLFHSDSDRYTYRSEIWADRSGYYLYLPFSLYYQFDARKLPAGLAGKTGGGFSADSLNNRLEIKYTCGVALMVAPFFLTAELISQIAELDSEGGLSLLFMRFMELAAVTYLFLGLWFLKRFLENYFTPGISLFVVVMVFVGTNLFYYSMIEGMMSHVYSFFLFSLFLFSLKKFLLSAGYRYFILLSIALSLAVLIRPTNILLGVLFFALDAKGVSGWLERLREFIKPKYLIVFIVILSLIFLPQLYYWKYLTGHWFYYPYGSEAFTNWRHPRVLEVLFSPVNGLLAYTPMVVFFLAGIVLMITQRRQNGWLIAMFFVVVTLTCAAWQMWYFGCSFGQRSFVEYYAILALPFAFFTTWILENRTFVVRTIIIFLIFLFTYGNVRYTVSLYQFEHCYKGSTWDWDHYHRSLARAGILSPAPLMQSFRNDFENLALSPVERPSQVFTRSGQYSIACHRAEVTPLFLVALYEFGPRYPKRIEVEAWVLKPGNRSTGASILYRVCQGTEILFEDELPIDSQFGDPLHWTPVRGSYIIPEVSDENIQIQLFLKNPQHAFIYVDDLQLNYRYFWN